MKIRLLLLFFLAFTASLTVHAQQMVGKKLPDVEVFTLVDSQAVKASALHTAGKPTMLIFWNSMMKPAKAELDSLQKVYPQWQKTYGLEVIAVASEYPKFKNTNLKKFLPNRSYTYRIYYDANLRLAGAMSATSAMPATYFLDKQGVVQSSMVGFDPADLAKFEEKLKELAR